MNKILVDIRNEDNMVKEQFMGRDVITIDDLLNKIVDLSYEIEILNEQLEDIKNDIQENYEQKKINYYEVYGINEKDFV